MNRLTHLDSLRGLAALAVIYFHVAEFALKNNRVYYDLEKSIFVIFTQWFDLGKIAVVVFFAISGFVIPFSLLKPRERPLLHFFISRFFRLYPAYWVSIAAGAIVLYYLINRSLDASTVIANVTMLQQFFGYENIIGVYWTLQIELVFYGLSVVLFMLGWLDRPSFVAGILTGLLMTALLLAALRHETGISLPVALPLGLAVMFWGLLWRMTVDRDHASRRLFLYSTFFILFMILPISVLAYSADTGFGETWYKYVISYWMAMFIFAFFTVYVKIAHPLFVYLGTVSYSLYLFGPIGQELANIIIKDSLYTLPVHVFVLLAVFLSIVIASFVYRFVEAPAIRIGRRLAGRQLLTKEKEG